MASAARLAAPVLLLALACATPPRTAPEPDAVEARVADLMARARDEEPAVTPRLGALARAAGGEMVKLEHRLKTRRSATRKMRARIASRPGLRAQEITLQDMLRYTMVVPDAPPGRYVEAVHDTLAALESAGHTVLLVKNYWPADDNYSGVNSVLETPSGLPWELQFHTPASLEVQGDTRPAYEELRKVSTPLPRKRALFDEMTEAWNRVAIPAGVLDEQNLHPEEKIRTRPRP